MNCPPIGRRCRALAGFSLIETLVAMAIVSFLGVALVKFFATSTRFRSDAEIRLETRQGLQVALDTLTRELRLAGPCLPTVGPGQFLAIQGVNDTDTLLDGNQDRILIRQGEMLNNLACIQTGVSDLGAFDGTAVINVENSGGFRAGLGALICCDASDGTPFDFFHVRTVVGNVLTVYPALTRTYGENALVVALDEHSYAIDTTTWGRPVLTMAVNRGAPEPLADGIVEMNVRYRLNRNCDTTCDVVDLPTDPERLLIREILVDLKARSWKPLQNGGYHEEAAGVSVRPRNTLS